MPLRIISSGALEVLVFRNYKSKRTGGFRAGSDLLQKPLHLVLSQHYIILTCWLLFRGALDGLYCEFRGLDVERIIGNERFRRITITIVWFISTLSLAVCTPNIGIVLELLGSLASCNVFIFPGKPCKRERESSW